MSAEIILDKIEALPALSDSVNHILDICDSPDSALNDLIEAVREDPLVSANILKAANAPEYGYKKEIRDVGQAVTLFGMVSMKGFVMATFIQGLEEIDFSPYNLDGVTFMELIRKQNAFVTQWYQHDKERLERLALTSHLMEIGKIILSRVVIDTSSQKLFAHHIESAGSLLEMIRIEKEIFDLTHEEVSAELITKWGFSEAIYAPLRHISQPGKSPQAHRKETLILYVTKLLINAHNFDKKQNLANAIAIVKKYNLAPEAFVKTYKSFVAEKVLEPA